MQRQSVGKILNYPDSNFRLQQSCSKLAASLTRQECKLETSYCKRRSQHASNLQQACCVKLIANCSKNRVCRRTSVALATQTAGLRLPKTDYAGISCIYTFYFKLSS
ncbi:hypothetical protein AVEN_47135-1 [Araneus ventricosus]|uniref:Uncharacterized protein n=1 Tax=Araneus ventricosus TaxID=182803 RepID=A0A4Y2N9R8_ARAVE|nr:hypothetical protein AVEN_47135-1 [Araneus ventricosus]